MKQSLKTIDLRVQRLILRDKTITPIERGDWKGQILSRSPVEKGKDLFGRVKRFLCFKKNPGTIRDSSKWIVNLS